MGFLQEFLRRQRDPEPAGYAAQDALLKRFHWNQGNLEAAAALGFPEPMKLYLPGRSRVFYREDRVAEWLERMAEIGFDPRGCHFARSMATPDFGTGSFVEIDRVLEAFDWTSAQLETAQRLNFPAIRHAGKGAISVAGGVRRVALAHEVTTWLDLARRLAPCASEAA